MNKQKMYLLALFAPIQEETFWPTQNKFDVYVIIEKITFCLFVTPVE